MRPICSPQLRPEPGREPPVDELKQVARLVAGGRKTVFLLGHMSAGAARGYILSRLTANIALLCGRPDGVVFLFDGPNEAGVRLMGCVPDRLPGARIAGDLSNLEHLRFAWGTDPVTERGLDAMEMIRAAESGELKALLLFGVDPSALFPETERTRRALSNMPLVVRAGMFPPVGAETAHAVLPTASVIETDGTYVNLEGQIQRVTKMVDPPGHARATARFILDLAGMLGSPLGFITAREVFVEITNVCPGWSLLKWEETGRQAACGVRSLRRQAGPRVTIHDLFPTCFLRDLRPLRGERRITHTRYIPRNYRPIPETGCNPAGLSGSVSTAALMGFACIRTMQPSLE